MLSAELVNQVISRMGTPTYVFDEDDLLNRVEAIKQALIVSEDKRVKLCYSIKANPFLIGSLVDVVDNLEVCSPGELEICKALHVPAGKIIYSGVHKEAEDITAAIEYGAGLLTAESVRHYELIRQVANELGKEVQVILRLNSKSQFGMSFEDIQSVIVDNTGSKSPVEIVGIHYFAGTQRKKLKHQAEELKMLREQVEALRMLRVDLPKLEYGPGLAYPYFEGDDFSDTLAPIHELADGLHELTDWCEPTIEMGRFIASSCGAYFTSVCDVKKAYDSNWCIIDGGINHINYLGQMMGMKTPVVDLVRDGKVYSHEQVLAQFETQTWAICGSLCTTNDVVMREYRTAELQIGDVLVFHHIGAYSVTEGMYLFLSRTMPKIVLHRKGELILLRDSRESWQINI